MFNRILLGLGLGFLLLSAFISGLLTFTVPSTAQAIQKDEPPIVDFAETDFVNDERKEKSKRFNKSYRGKILEDSRVSVISVTGTRFDSVEAIPLKESDLVLIGTVKQSRAFLSENRTAIYSEFSVNTEQLISEKIPLGVSPSSEILVSFPSGRVRFPSGHIQSYEIDGMESLIDGGSYILFLKKTSWPENFDLLAAYKLLENKISPISDAQRFTFYKGQTVEEFLKNLKAGDSK